MSFVKDLNLAAPVQVHTLSNASGMSVDIADFGASIMAIRVPDKFGQIADVVLGFNDPQDYQFKKHPHFGGVVGRVANRIANGRFSLAGTDYLLVINSGENHIHGGNKGFDRLLWQLEAVSSQSVTLSYLSPDGDEGYPGQLWVQVTYTLTEQNELRIHYLAQADQETPVNLTNHAYFNLKGESSGSIANHNIQINASNYTPVNGKLIPTGIEAVEDTPLDLRQLQPLALGLNQEGPTQLARVGYGYDHNFVIDAEQGRRLQFAARVEEPETGRVLEVETTEPGIQLYTGNFLDGTIRNKQDSGVYKRHSGFCLETQHYPDSVNQPEFPSVFLKPGEMFNSETVFRFSVLNHRLIA